MIQRIQSLYLTFIIILSLLLMNGSILNFTDASGNTVYLSATGILSEQGLKIIAQIAPSWSLISLLAIICLISIVAILMFRNRRVQLLLTLSLIVLSALLTGTFLWLGYTLINDFKMTFSPAIKIAFPILILIFSVLAFKGIQKDDRLVKSYERLR
jgi:hypothetical protein